MKRSKRVVKKTAAKKKPVAKRKVAKKAVRKPAKGGVVAKVAGKKKMTIKEYAELESLTDLEYARMFSDKNPSMSMQTYFRKIGLPSTAKIFKLLYNE